MFYFPLFHRKKNNFLKNLSSIFANCTVLRMPKTKRFLESSQTFLSPPAFAFHFQYWYLSGPPSFILALLPLLAVPRAPSQAPLQASPRPNTLLPACLSLWTGLSSSASVFIPQVLMQSRGLTARLCISNTQLSSPACTSPLSSTLYLPPASRTCLMSTSKGTVQAKLLVFPTDRLMPESSSIISGNSVLPVVQARTRRVTFNSFLSHVLYPIH